LRTTTAIGTIMARLPQLRSSEQMSLGLPPDAAARTCASAAEMSKSRTQWPDRRARLRDAANGLAPGFAELVARLLDDDVLPWGGRR